MKALLTYIDAHPHKRFVVVFDDLKRFARDTEFHFKLKKAFRDRDVLLRCLNYTFGETPEEEFSELIMAGQAQLERKQNRRQVVQKMKSRLEMGYWTFAGKRGYDMIKDALHGKLLIANKVGLTIIKPALEKFASGDLLRKIDVARFLMDRGFWKNSKGNPERYIDEVSDMLTDVVHCGDIEYPKWGVARRQGKHKGIISLDTFNRIAKRLAKDVAKSRIRNDISDDFPLGASFYAQLATTSSRQHRVQDDPRCMNTTTAQSKAVVCTPRCSLKKMSSETSMHCFDATR